MFPFSKRAFVCVGTNSSDPQHIVARNWPLSSYVHIQQRQDGRFRRDNQFGCSLEISHGDDNDNNNYDDWMEGPDRDTSHPNTTAASAAASARCGNNISAPSCGQAEDILADSYDDDDDDDEALLHYVPFSKRAFVRGNKIAATRHTSSRGTGLCHPWDAMTTKLLSSMFPFQSACSSHRPLFLVSATRSRQMNFDNERVSGCSQDFPSDRWT